MAQSWFQCRLCLDSGLNRVFDREVFVLEHAQLSHPKAFRKRLRSGHPPEQVIFRKYHAAASGMEAPVGHPLPGVVARSSPGVPASMDVDVLGAQSTDAPNTSTSLEGLVLPSSTVGTKDRSPSVARSPLVPTAGDDKLVKPLLSIDAAGDRGRSVVHSAQGSTASSNANKSSIIGGPNYALMGAGDSTSSTPGNFGKTLVIDGVDDKGTLRYHWVNIPTISTPQSTPQPPSQSKDIETPTYAKLMSNVPRGSFVQSSSSSKTASVSKTSSSAKRNAQRKRSRISAAQGTSIAGSPSFIKPLRNEKDGPCKDASCASVRPRDSSFVAKRRRAVTETNKPLTPWRGGSGCLPYNCGCKLPFVTEQDRTQHMHAVHNHKHQAYVCTVCHCHFPASRDFLGHILHHHREEVSKGVYPEPSTFSRLSGEGDRFLRVILGTYTCIPFCRLCSFAHFELYSRQLGCWCPSRRPTPGEPRDYRGSPLWDILPLKEVIMFPKDTIPPDHMCTGPGIPFVPPS